MIGNVLHHGARVRQIERAFIDGSIMMLCLRTWRLGWPCPSMKCVSRSVATTWPVVPARSASQSAIPPAPHPTSRHRHPSATPSFS
jgi:hypothetical protein